MTRTQFIVSIAVAIAREGQVRAAVALPLARQAYHDFMRDARVSFGSPDYAWDENAAGIIAQEYLEINARHPTTAQSEIFGYFTAANQTKPAFDPGLNAPCPVCLLPLSSPMKTPSLMLPGDSRSFFYRVHKSCYENTNAIEHLESSLIDTLPTTAKAGGE